MDTCFTCCETYNKSTKCQVTCYFDDCKYSSCKGCVRTYLLNSTNDPHCMNCKKQWNENFVIQSLNRSFIDNDYKKHRKELLVDREISKLPETMNDAEKYKKILIENEKIKENNEKMSELRKQLNELSSQKYEHTLNIRKIQSNQTERKKFIMACPNNHCRGFLSTQYKCDLCNYYTCPDCHEIIGYTKNDEHICNKDSVESAKLIKQETKPCPTCGVRIYKISGCFSEKTKILLWNGDYKYASNIEIGDELVGDDGKKRIVFDTIKGYDKMYKIKQNNGNEYIVNSEHTLVLRYTSQGYISNLGDIYKLYWLDNSNYKFHSKNFDNKDEAEIYRKNLNLQELINIPIKHYLELPKSRKESLKGIKLQNYIDWEYKEIELDPYILGTWLGDGYSNGKEMCSNDTEIIDYWNEWCKNNNAELVKTTNNFRYYIKNIYNSSNTGKFNNPLKEKLNIYNLVNNKHIPEIYLLNSKENRLKLLAGIIDTDGCVQNNGRRITIITTIEELSKNIELLSKSLGYRTSINIKNRDNEIIFDREIKTYKKQYCINISGKNIHEIPTLLERKKCKIQNGGVNLLTTNIEVEYIGYDYYYGWSVDNNHRFVLNDFTIVKNCDQMWCPECKAAFSWKTGLIDKGVVHNPHFYQHMRNNNNGTAPRNPHDEVCGGLISVYQLRGNIINKVINFPNISQKISNIHRVISHITYQSLVQSRENVRRYQDFKDLRIQYILNKKTRVEMATQIYRSDNLRKKYTELLHIDELFSVVGIEVFNTLSNYNGHEFIKEIEFQLSNLNKIRIYCNNEYKKISATYNQKVMNVNDQWIITNNKYKMNDYKPNINLGGNNHEAGGSDDN